MKKYILLFSIFFFNYLYAVVGIINTESSLSSQKDQTIQVIEKKEKELSELIDNIKEKLELQKKATIERYRILAGVRVLSQKTLAEKMKTLDNLKKTKNFLEIELNLQDIENLE